MRRALKAHEVADALDDDGGLARAGGGEEEERMVRGRVRRVALLRVESHYAAAAA